MPRSWEQEYHHKKHRANVRKAKGTMAPRGGARRAVPKGRGSSFHEQGDALQASLDATAAAITQLKDKVGMTDAQREALTTLEENADSLQELLGQNAVAAKIEKAEQAIASLRDETRRMQQQLEAQEAATPPPEDLEEWLEKYDVPLEPMADKLTELGVGCPMDLLELDAEDIAALKRPLKKVPQRKFEKALAQIGARDTASAEGRVEASKSPLRGRGKASSGMWDVTPSKAAAAADAQQVRKREAARRREDQRQWKMDQEAKRKKRIAEEPKGFSRAGEVQRKRDEMKAKEDERKQRVKEQRAKERARREAAHLRIQEEKEAHEARKHEEQKRRKEEQKRRREDKLKAREEEERLRKRIEALERKKEQRAAAKRKAQTDARNKPKASPKRSPAKSVRLLALPSMPWNLALT